MKCYLIEYVQIECGSVEKHHYKAGMYFISIARDNKEFYYVRAENIEDELKELLYSSCKLKRIVGAIILRRVYNRNRYIDLLFDVLLEERDEIVIRAIIITVGYIGNDDAIRKLIKYFFLHKISENNSIYFTLIEAFIIHDSEVSLDFVKKEFLKKYKEGKSKVTLSILTRMSKYIMKRTTNILSKLYSITKDEMIREVLKHQNKLGEIK